MAEWIWYNSHPEIEEYGYFRAVFNRGKQLKISADTDYAAYVNGRLAGFGCFPGWKNEKYYDTLDISPFVADGENVLEITARYEGVNSATHIEDGAGLWFEIEGSVSSGEDTLCCEDTRYVSHNPRHITGQLGLASDMVNAALPSLRKAVVTGKQCILSPRPVKLMDMLPPQEGRLIDPSKRLYDLGRETAGYIYLETECSEDTTCEVAYGEHMADGCVRQKIGSRDFSLRFYCKTGKNSFRQLFVRAAGRYLEIHAPESCKVQAVGIIPVLYPMTEKPCTLEGLDRQIYDTCVRTLRLCMHYHYEDCPWREQALYVLDSRNQMLCGYKVFEETEYARANLAFIAKGRRADGMLELTYPAVNTPAIPFFSAMYPVEVWEYVKHTGDTSLIPEVMETIKSIMDTLSANIASNGLIGNLPAPYWNFYEWSEGSDGHGELNPKAERCEKYDLILNCAYCFAADCVKKICEKAGIDAPELRDTQVKQAIQHTFCKDGVYVSSTVNPRKTRLGNAFALLIGLGSEKTLDALLNDKTLVPETLSMAGYVYDAIIAACPNGKNIVLDDIRKKYGYMLAEGATSFWETLNGESDFDKAGSLCHGWSAIPIVYLV